MEAERREPRDVLLAHRIAIRPQLRQRAIYREGVPQDDRVEHQAKRTELVLLPFAVALAQLTALPVKDPPAQLVAGLLDGELRAELAAVPSWP